jgi:hypothetical protein
MSEPAKQTIQEKLRVLANLRYQAQPAARAMNKAADELDRLQAEVERLWQLLNAKGDFAERHVQLGKFYGAKNTDELIDKMEAHIAKMQSKLAAATLPFSFATQRVREG